MWPETARAATGDETNEIQGVVREVYRVYSVTRDPAAYLALLADGYVLLENGEIMTAAQDIAAMPKLDDGSKRTDAFEFHQVRTSADTAWVVYFLRSDFEDAKKGARHRDYLETMILRRAGKGWKVALLHSTRIEPVKK